MMDNMESIYSDLMEAGQVLSAEIDTALEDRPDDEELKKTQEFLADRHAGILSLRDG